MTSRRRGDLEAIRDGGQQGRNGRRAEGPRRAAGGREGRDGRQCGREDRDGRPADEQWADGARTARYARTSSGRAADEKNGDLGW
jgi:hypothetical protein